MGRRVLAKTNGQLFAEGRLALGVTNVELAERLRCSRRTVQRYCAGASAIVPQVLLDLANLLVDEDRAVADEIWSHASAQIEHLGWPAPAPLRSAIEEEAARLAVSAARAPSSSALAAAVVCAAAEAMDVSPRALRPALRAALRVAREHAMSIESLDDALGEKG
jgi:transcriptional regulator with XRE-family HTH domain